jgi:formylglycine-generating enzyme required for sulfatase activity/thiol-disulfide isomerase/thioredoxin
MTYACRAHALRRLFAIAIAIATLSTSPARAADGFDVRELLQRSGTRALAVEFYATWCKPCMKSLPEWKRLFEKYADDGFRLVVVSTMDPEGQCQPIGFTPTEFVCDPEGRIADAFGIKPGQGGGLPAAFLWSWQGELLVRGGHVDAVRKKLPEALRSFPTVAVDAAKAPGMPAENLAQLIRSELSADGRFQVEPSKATLKKLKGYLKRSQTDPRYSDKSRCELGMQVSPNTLVKASVIAGRLTVGAYSVESGCQIGSGSSRWSAKRSTVAVRQAVDDLLSTLVRKRPEMPGAGLAGARPAPATPKGPSLSGGSTTAAVGRLIVEGKPKGATVEITGPGGKTQTGRMPFQAAVAPGKWTIKVTNAGYEVWTKTQLVEVDRTSVVSVTMVKPGILEVVGAPEGAEVQIDGPSGFSGKTGLPATLKDAPTGEYRIRVSRPGYTPHEGKATVTSGATKTVTVRLKRIAAAADTDGDGIPDLDDACPTEREDLNGYQDGDGCPDARKVAALTLRTNRETLAIEWVRIPGGSFKMGRANAGMNEVPVHIVRIRSFDLMKSEVTVGQYRACVDAGACTKPGTKGYKDRCNWDKPDREDHPVNCVNWNQAHSFAKWAGGRLPSEAEWEYAARSGGKSRRYPWGNRKASCSRAVMGNGKVSCGKEQTWPVCSKRRGNSRHGICDLAGSVWEWVQDGYYSDYNGAPADGSAWEGIGSRVRRGGGMYDGPMYLEAMLRVGSPESYRSNDLGFRVARSIP